MAEDIRFRHADPVALYRLTFDSVRDPALTAAVIDRLGAPLPQPRQPSGRRPLLIWQGPHDMLVDGLETSTAALHQTIAGHPALLGDAGAGLAIFDLWGDDLDHRLSHDRPDAGLCSRVMKLAGLRVTAVWLGEAQIRVRLYVDRSHASYMSAWLTSRWNARPDHSA